MDGWPRQSFCGKTEAKARELSVRFELQVRAYKFQPGVLSTGLGICSPFFVQCFEHLLALILPVAQPLFQIAGVEPFNDSLPAIRILLWTAAMSAVVRVFDNQPLSFECALHSDAQLSALEQVQTSLIEVDFVK